MLVLQPTPFCNISCDYCFLPNRHIKKRLSERTLTAIIDNLLHDDMFSPRITVLWHTGEPLTVGIKFYDRAMDLIASKMPAGIEVKHSILTNGTLIDEKWCNFFIERNVHVGVSCDGPEFLHNGRRKTRSGLGTFDRVIRGIQLLNDHKIEFYILSVLSETSLRHADELIQFCIENNIQRLCFNVEETEGINNSRTLSSPAFRELVYDFFSRMLFHSFKTQGAPYIREIDHMLGRIFRQTETPLRNHLTEPFKILNVDVDGKWSTFSPELTASGFLFGDLASAPISQQVDLSHFQAVHESIQLGVKKCRDECEYFFVCGGGRPSNKWAEHGRFDLTETNCCIADVKAIADACVNGIGQYVLKNGLNELGYVGGEEGKDIARA